MAPNLPAPYSDSYSIPNTPDSPKFSDYLASVTEKSGKTDERAVSAGTSAAEDKEDESPAVIEKTEKTEKPGEDAGENYLAMTQAAVHNADTALPQPAHDSDHNEETPVKLSNDAAAKDGAAPDLEAAAQAPKIVAGTTAPPPDMEAESGAKPRMPDIEKNAFADKTDDGGNKTGQTESASKMDLSKDAGAPKNGDGKPLNASEGIYVDEKKPAAEHLAAETNEGAAKKKQTRFETASAADKRDGAAVHVEISAVHAATGAAGTAGQAKGAEKDGGGKTSGEKKSAERTKRSTGYVEINAGPLDGAAQITEAREPAWEVRRVSAGGAPETEITVNLRGETRGASAGERDFGSFKASGTFENFLARELQQSLNGEIVRQAQVMLREGGEGTIRLSLKPEFLGKVKIHLEMTENKITGKIVVESGEALRAFEREMQALEQSFRSEGFDGANLSLELAEHKDPRSSEGGWQANSEKSLIRTASSKYDGSVDKVLYFGAAYSAKQINVLI
jgi:flagellar hook-length control protein FliK